MLRAFLALCRRRPLRFFAGVTILAGILAFGQVAWSHWVSQHAEPGRGAHWIWADEVAEAARPVTFWAVRDFEIEDLDAFLPATMVVAVDESYELWVNGYRVGAGSYVQNSEADAYSVDDFLQSGWNRLLVEARSSRGAGGLLANLRAGQDGEVVLGSDESWRIVRHFSSGVLGGRTLFRDLEEVPKTWSRAPTGRFRLEGLLDRAIHRESWLRLPKMGAPGGAKRVKAERLRHLSDVDSWTTLDSFGLSIPAGQVVFDFGREVYGVLDVVLTADNEAGLLYFDPPFNDDGPEIQAQDRRPDVVVAPFPGRREWRDTLPRRFRFVTLVGFPNLEKIRVLEVDSADLFPDPPNPNEGVFGLPPAKQYLPAEEAVWDRLRALGPQ